MTAADETPAQPTRGERLLAEMGIPLPPKTPTVGRCMSLSPDIFGIGRRSMCRLPHGHLGAHSDDEAHWTFVEDPAPDDARPAAVADQADALDLDAVRERLRRALDEVCGLADGSRKWTMRIPADETRDSDLVISVSLDDLDELLPEYGQQFAELAEARAEVERLYDERGRLLVEGNAARASAEHFRLNHAAARELHDREQERADRAERERDEARAATEVKRLLLKPGDVLVLETDRVTSAQTADEMHRRLAEWFPGHEVRIIDGAHLTVVEAVGDDGSGT